MRDPATLAHRIVRPWPVIKEPYTKNNPKWALPISRRDDGSFYVTPFAYVNGKELYWPSMIEIWHVDPKGDIGPPCHGRKHWKWHVHHMQWPKFQPYYNFRQKYITKCMHCGEKSSKERGPVNHSDGMHSPRRFHGACMGIRSDMIHNHDPKECWPCQNK